MHNLFKNHDVWKRANTLAEYFMKLNAVYEC